MGCSQAFFKSHSLTAVPLESVYASRHPSDDTAMGRSPLVLDGSGRGRKSLPGFASSITTWLLRDTNATRPPLPGQKARSATTPAGAAYSRAWPSGGGSCQILTVLSDPAVHKRLPSGL